MKNTEKFFMDYYWGRLFNSNVIKICVATYFNGAFKKNK